MSIRDKWTEVRKKLAAASIKKKLLAEVGILLVLGVAAYRRGGLGFGPAAPRSAPYWTGILDPSRAIDWTHAGVAGGIPNYTVDCGTVPPTGIIDWHPKTTYQLGAKISDTFGNLEVVTTAGTSGTTEPPNFGPSPPGWPTSDGAFTPDGSVTWQMHTGNTPPGTDTANVTNAVINCDGKQGVVHLTAGHYYFTDGITFNKSFLYPQTPFPQFSAPVSQVLVKGQGPMQTYLHFPRRGACSGGDICVQSYAATVGLYAGGGSYSATAYPGSGANWLGASSLGVYNKGDTMLIAGPWLPSASEPSIGDVIFLDQNNDARGICPLNPPSPPYNCTVPGATESGNIATIVTSVPHGFQVGQCVGVGDVGGFPPPPNTNIAGPNAVGYNIGLNPDKTTICNGNPPGPPGLPAWWQITHVGCIVSGSFVDQASCGVNPLVAFQYNAGVSGLPPSGGGQATVDSGGVLLASVGGATMTAGSDPQQSARLCPSTINAPNPSCGNGEISVRAQFEAKTIQQILLPGQGSCPNSGSVYKCYVTDLPLYANNWRSSQEPGMYWTGKKNSFDGLEGFTALTEHDKGVGSMGLIRFTNAWNGWVRNVRAIEINRNFVWNNLSGRTSIVDNYVGGTSGGASTAYAFEDIQAADTLIVNNICQHTSNCLMTQLVMGRVAAYNYMVDSGYSEVLDLQMPMVTLTHLAAFYNLFEGNNSPHVQTDNQHGSAGVSTVFRSRSRGQDLPIKNTNRVGLNSTSFNRGLNFVGNVMGTVGQQNHYKDDNPANLTNAIDQVIFSVGRWKTNIVAQGIDALATSTMLRWGNYDAVTQTTRWCGTGTEPTCTCGVAPVNIYCQIQSEIPTQGFPFLAPNAIPADHNLPPSFIFSAPPPFWTTTWGTPGWPAIGPDVDATGSVFDTSCAITVNVGTGPGTFSQCDGAGADSVSGAHHAYQIPAQVCYNNLPVDPQFQKSFVVRGASHNGISGANGLVTLTVNNTLNTAKPFTYTIQVTGITPSGYNGTFQVHNATATTITYWMNAPPTPSQYISGGTVTTPNYKVFDASMCYPNEMPPTSAGVADGNYYDNPDGTCRNMASAYDGPAALPSRCFNTSLANTPSPGATFTVPSTAYLTVQSAFNAIGGAIPCGSTIVISTATHDESNLTYPAVACNASNWLTVIGDQAAMLPLEGTRISPAWLGTASLPSRPPYNSPAILGTYMPKIRNTAYSQPALSFATVNSASGPVPSYVRFIGLYFAQPGPGSPQCSGHDCQTGWQNSIVESGCFGVGVLCPDHVVFDRVIVGPDDLTGNSTVLVCTGIRLTGTNMAVVDSYIYEVAGSAGYCETHGIGFGNANGGTQQGPYKIVNNFIEAGGENYFVGGGHSTSTPTNIQIRRNHLFKPRNLWAPGQPGYLGTPMLAKNLGEIKNALQALIEGNIYDSSWYGHDASTPQVFLSDQSGYGPLLNASSNLTDVHQPFVQDVTFRYNVVRHTVRGMFIDSEDCTTKTQVQNPCGVFPPGATATKTERVSVHDNLFDDVSPKYFTDGNLNSGIGNGFDGVAFSTGNGMQSVPPVGIFNSLTLDHNTVVSNSFRHNFTIASITVSGSTATLTTTAPATSITAGQRLAVFGACTGFNSPNVVVASVTQLSPVLIFTYTTTATGSCGSGFVSNLGQAVGGSFNMNEYASDSPIVDVAEEGSLAELLMTSYPPFHWCVAAGTPSGCTTPATFTVYGLTGSLICYNNNQSSTTCPPSGTPATWPMAGWIICTGAGTGGTPVGSADASDCKASGQQVITWNHPMTGLSAANANAKSYQSYWLNPGPNPNPQWQNVVVTNNIFSGKVQQPAGVCQNGPTITSNGVLTLCGVVATSGAGAVKYNCNVQAAAQLTGQGNIGDTLPPNNTSTIDDTLETIGFVNYNSDNLGQGVANLGDLALAPSSPFFTGVSGCDGKPTGANNTLLQQYTVGVQ